jgi:hypothetical protein
VAEKISPQFFTEKSPSEKITLYSGKNLPWWGKKSPRNFFTEKAPPKNNPGERKKSPCNFKGKTPSEKILPGGGKISRRPKRKKLSP